MIALGRSGSNSAKPRSHAAVFSTYRRPAHQGPIHEKARAPAMGIKKVGSVVDADSAGDTFSVGSAVIRSVPIAASGSIEFPARGRRPATGTHPVTGHPHLT